MAGPVLHLSLPVHDLAAARRFYESVLGCRVGRVGDGWLDVWFFGMQLTLQERPDEVAPPEAQGVRHLGVALDGRRPFEELVARLRDAEAVWVSEPATDATGALSGKTGAKVADPSGNVIELKFYDDPAALLGDREPGDQEPADPDSDSDSSTAQA